MLGILALLLIIWLAFVVIGFVVHTLFWLAVIGIVLFLVTSAFGWVRRNSRAGTRP